MTIRNTAEDTGQKTAFLFVIITSYIFMQKILQTIDGIDDDGRYACAHHIPMGSEQSSDPL